MQKQCRKCKIAKDVGEFYKEPRNNDGLYFSCKKCMNTNHYAKYGKKYFQNNLEKCRERRRNFIPTEETKAKQKISSKKYREKNKDKRRKYERKWRKTPTGRKSRYETRRKIREKYPWYKTYDSIRARCSYKNSWYYKKGIKSFLTATDLKFLWFRDRAYLMKKPSIDRLNNDENYTLENCRYIEMSKNRPQKR